MDWKLVLSYDPSARAYGVQKAEGFDHVGDIGNLRPARTHELGKWLQGNYPKPRPSASPGITAVRLEFLDVPERATFGQETNYSYGKNNMAVESNPRDVRVTIDDHAADGQVERWTLHFGAPFEQSLKVGEYGGAYDWYAFLQRPNPPVPANPGPLIQVSRCLLNGDKRTREWGCGLGEFVVREIELKDQKVTRLAIDFITDTRYGSRSDLPERAGGRVRPRPQILRGSLRLNSQYEPSVPGIDFDAPE
jgi:hypothetical protein